MPSKTTAATRLLELRTALSQNNVSAITAAVLRLGDSDDKSAVSDLLKLLKSDKRYSVKHAAALALRELRDARAVPILIDLIQDQSFANRRGTFVYALQTLPWWRSHLENIARLILDSNYEVREMAFQAIETATTRLNQRQKKEILNIVIEGLTGVQRRRNAAEIRETLWAALFLLLGRPMREIDQLWEEKLA